MTSYKYHVFISYAHVSDTLTGWVSSFKQKLEGKLNEKLPGGTAQVFFDAGELGVGPLRPDLQAALSSSAILLIVLSNRWLERPWCQEELARFVEAAGGPSNAQERIVLVRIEDVKQNRLPKVLQDCHLYDFFKVHPTRKVTLTYGSREFPELESDYALSMLELVGDEDRPGLVTRLLGLTAPQVDEQERAVISSGEEQERPMIFLANCTPDLQRDRNALKRHLEDKGFQVVPAGTFYHAPPGYDEEVRRLLSGSTLFIQIVGAFRYEPTEQFPDGYEHWQLHQARTIKGADVVRWRRPDLLSDDVEDAVHREFVFADDVTRCDLEEFKVILGDKLREIDSRRPGTIEREGITVLVNAANPDNKMAEEVGTRLEDLCIAMDLRSSLYADVVGERSSLFDVARNNPCHGLMIVYGSCGDTWVRRQVKEGRSVALLLKQKVPVCALYVGPPADKPPLEPRPARFGVIDFREEERLRDFVRQVAGRKV
ncbi:MAG: toll/interleukin-1 receptor domain-containing protein [Verrucomicrobia bacterium]|nr:toll/interleukin-1 receptor domain-containing protein [Verrucomicrobiota bacterium]